jgi:Flp pilus assembly protein CpaB
LNKIILIVGLICAGATAFLVSQRISAVEARLQPVTYLTFSRDSGETALYAGDEITERHLGQITLPNADDVFGLETDLIRDTPAQRAWLKGKRLNTNIPRGRVLTYDLFEDLAVTRLDEAVRPGYRAISLSVNAAGSLNNSLVPGNRIDLVGVVDDVENPRAEMVLEDVKVIAVGDILSYDQLRSEDSRRYSTITIEVSPQQGVALSTARQRLRGNFIVMLRNQCETGEASATCQ